MNLISLNSFYKNSNNSNPAPTALPITPATLGPIACINKKFSGSSLNPSLCTTLAAIGTAETPAEQPIEKPKKTRKSKKKEEEVTNEEK